MENASDVFVLSATRTAIGKYGGGLAPVPPCDLAATVVREAVGRARVDPDAVGHAVFGNVIHTEVRDMYLARVAAVNGGLGVQTPAFTLNRLCGSGLQAIVSAAQAVRLGDCEVAVAGGAESMSRGQYWLPAMRAAAHAGGAGHVGQARGLGGRRALAAAQVPRDAVREVARSMCHARAAGGDPGGPFRW